MSKIGVLAYDTSDYTSLVGYFDNPVKLQRAVDKLNAERLDVYDGEPARAEVHVKVVERVPDVIDDAFLNRLVGMLTDAGVEIERAEDVEERLRAAAEEELDPIVTSPGQMELK